MVEYGLYKEAPFFLHWFELSVTECDCDLADMCTLLTGEDLG